jgi:hypothetical protein
MKLAVGMAKMINAGTKSGQKQLKDRCDLERSKVTGLGQMLKGRQYVRLLVDNFSTIDGSEQMFGLDHLMKITFDGDLHAKWMQWNRVRSRIQGGYVAEELVRDTLYRKIKSRPDLREDMRRYERAEPGSPEKTYKFLAASIEVAIKLEREERNLKEKDALLAPHKNTEAHDTAAAVENKGKGNDKNKTDGKAKKCFVCGGEHLKKDCPKKDDKVDTKSTKTPVNPKNDNSGKGAKNGATPRAASVPPATGGKGNKIARVRDSNGKTLCIYHILNKCTKDPCSFSHEKLSEQKKKDALKFWVDSGILDKEHRFTDALATQAAQRKRDATSSNKTDVKALTNAPAEKIGICYEWKHTGKCTKVKCP